MTIKFSDDLKAKMEEFRNEYLNAAENGEDAEEVKARHGQYMQSFSEALKDEVMAQAKAEVQNGTDDKNIALARGSNVLTAQETKFINQLVDPDLDTYKEDLIIPETIIERVFEDAQESRPLLQRISFSVAGINARVILAEREGQAVWGEIFGKIQGQIDANFKEINFSQNKLTAFAVVPKDLIQFGPQWVERFVRQQLSEAMAIALEYGVVNGRGTNSHEPVGLTKQMNKNEDGNITSVEDKAARGTLTFATPEDTVNELAGVMEYHSTKENGNPVNVSGSVSLLVNPQDQFKVQAQYTVLTDNGQWVTSLPYNIDIVPSVEVEKDQVVSFVSSRYTAVNTGSLTISRYDQTLALEDADVYISKHFAHGMPVDNKVSAVYNLDIADLVTGENTGETTP